jgi:hypothetical protein
VGDLPGVTKLDIERLVRVWEYLQAHPSRDPKLRQLLARV